MAKLVSKTYGEALFDAAVEDGCVDKLLEDAVFVMEAFRDNEDLGKLLNNPKIAREEKAKVVSGIFKDNVSDDMQELRIKFDKLTSHDITFVGIIQTARASGLEKFPIPYVLTNCHNSLCAVGGTINEDDHVFGLSAAVKYGGCFVPANMAVIHQYAREMMSGCGKMISPLA